MSESHVFDARLTVCIDFKIPQAYLAKDPTCALAEELGVAVEWLPLIVAPMKPPEATAGGDERGKRHRVFRARYVERDLRRYAESRGLDLGDIYRATDSSLAGIGLLWVRQRSPGHVRAYLDRLFERHWVDAVDIEDAAAIAGVVEEVGADVEGIGEYLRGEGRQSLERLQESLHGAGVQNVPAYVVDGEIFYGRQHLPMVRWLLSGKQGQPPI